VTVTWGQVSGIVRHGHATAPAKRAGRATAGAFAALLALAGYVVTFAFAGNGCWLDVAAAVGVSAIVGYGMLLGALRLTRGAEFPGAAHRNATTTQVFAQGTLAAAAVLVCAAAMNVLLYETTGIGTLGARVVALLFVPLHCGLLIAADLTAALAIVVAAGRRGLPRLPALLIWALGFNIPAVATFLLLRWSRLI
jgi:hypothetical protein